MILGILMSDTYRAIKEMDLIVCRIDKQRLQQAGFPKWSLHSGQRREILGRSRRLGKQAKHASCQEGTDHLP